MPLPEITITIEAIGQDEYLARASDENGSEICHNKFAFAPHLLVDLEPQWMIERAIPRQFAEPVKRGPTDPVAPAEDVTLKLEQYGRRLFGFLFGDGVRWANFLEFNPAYWAQARLTLALHKEAAALWRLPWEYLHDDQGFLVLSRRFWLARQPFGLGRLAPAPAEPPVRILVVIAAPDDQNPLDTEEEIGVIQAALDEPSRAGQVLVEYLDDATLPAIGEALRRFKPHVLHYTGHGYYDKKTRASYLALEDDIGQTCRAGIADLRPLLKDAPGLRLVVLSGCQTAQTSDVDAFTGVATGLLNEEIAAVLAMQYSILDQSGIQLAAAFYAALGRGESPESAVQRARIALWQLKEGPGYDWGVPALYLRTAEMTLVRGQAGAGAEFSVERDALDVGGLPLPPHFVGRKPELRQLRKALRDPGVSAAYVRGIGGMGKSSLAAKFLERPGLEVDGSLVIRCHQVAPLDIPAKLATFLAAQGKANHAEAAALLLDSRQDAGERARQALEMLGAARYVIVIDNFESVLDLTRVPVGTNGEAEGESGAYLVLPALAALMEGLVRARWRGLLLFTGRYRWQGLDEGLGRGTAIELALNELSARQSILLMDNLPHLHAQPLATKVAVYHKVGGHPKSLELLEGWLASGQIRNLLGDPTLDGLLRKQWEDYFLRALLAQLSPTERAALERLSIINTNINDELFAYAGVTPETRQRWLELSLLQRQRTAAPDVPEYLLGLLPSLPEAERQKLLGEARDTLHPLVAEYLRAGLSPEAKRGLHRWAADFYGRPFVEMARDYSARTGQTWSEAGIEAFSRIRDGVVGQLAASTKDLAQARSALERALAWRDQLFAAGEFEAAAELVTAVFAILARWGQRDRAKALLNETIATLVSINKAVAQGNLANMLMEEGRLDEALNTTQEFNRTFEAAGARQQMATALHQTSG